MHPHSARRAGAAAVLLGLFGLLLFLSAAGLFLKAGRTLRC